MPKLSNEKFLENLYNKKSGRFIALEQYKSHRSKMLFYHKPCGNTFYAITNSILNTRSEGCPYCGAQDRVTKRTKTLDKFIKEIEELYPNMYSIPNDQKMVNNKSKINVQCNKCGYLFKVSPSNLLRDRGCPKCCRTASNTSKNVVRIEKYLENNGYIELNSETSDIEKYFIREKTFEGLVDQKPLRFDFAIYSYDKLKLLIEYDGEFHFRQIDQDKLELVQKHDNLKNQYCIDHGYLLYRLNYKNFKIKSYEKILDNMLAGNVSELNEYVPTSVGQRKTSRTDDDVL